MRLGGFFAWGAVAALTAAGCAGHKYDDRSDRPRGYAMTGDTYGGQTAYGNDENRGSSTYRTSNTTTGYTSSTYGSQGGDTGYRSNDNCDTITGYGTSDGRSWMTRNGRPWNGSTYSSSGMGSDNGTGFNNNPNFNNNNNNNFNPPSTSGTTIVNPNPPTPDTRGMGSDVGYSTSGGKSLVACIHGLEGNNDVKGKVFFTQEGDGVHVVCDLEGLKPNTRYGLKLHQFVDEGGTTTGDLGDVWTPRSTTTEDLRKGKLGMLESDGSGKARLDTTLQGLTLTGEDGLIGHSVVLHEKTEKTDETKSGTNQPGTTETNRTIGRIGVGVIGYSKGDLNRTK